MLGRTTRSLLLKSTTSCTTSSSTPASALLLRRTLGSNSKKGSGKNIVENLQHAAEEASETIQEAAHETMAKAQQAQKEALQNLKEAQKVAAQHLEKAVEDADETIQKAQGNATRLKNGHKNHVVVLGSGWAGFQIARSLNKKKFKVTVISDRNHFLFTPLLPSTTVGTLEYRAIQEPVRTIPKIKYYQALAKKIDFDAKQVVCDEVFKPKTFSVPYDYLVVAVGSVTNTFNVPGVNEEKHVYFLKQLSDARAIRQRIIEVFEKASYPDVTEEEKAKLLSFVVVGGGPTSVEYASELHDFLEKEVNASYPELKHLVKITLVEASNMIMGTFHQRLVKYVSKLFEDRKIIVKTGTSVTKIENDKAYLKDGSTLDYGCIVWATGVKATPLLEKLEANGKVTKGQGHRIMVDARLRVIGQEEKGVFALGDCALSNVKPLPALAQVAQQQAKYLAKVLNKYSDPSENPTCPPFTYNHLGSMAQLGMWKGVVDASKIEQEGKKVPGAVLSGLSAFILWRSAYWTKSMSTSKKMMIPMYWLKSWLLGRDIGRF